MITFFKDLFDGAAASFVGRSPDVGAAYIDGGFAGASGVRADIEVDGAGAMTPVHSGTMGSAASVMGAMYAPYSVAITWRYTGPTGAANIFVLLELINTVSNSQALNVQLTSVPMSSTVALFFGIYDITSSRYDQYDAGAITPVVGDNTILMEVNADAVTFYMNGVQVYTTALLPQIIPNAVQITGAAAIAATDVLTVYDMQVDGSLPSGPFWTEFVKTREIVL